MEGLDIFENFSAQITPEAQGSALQYCFEAFYVS